MTKRTARMPVQPGMSASSGTTLQRLAVTLPPAHAHHVSESANEAKVTVANTKAKQGMTRAQWVIVFLLLLSVIINYIDRSNLCIAAPVIQQQLALTPLQIGMLMSAFFWTYAVLQVSGIVGWCTDTFPMSLVMVAATCCGRCDRSCRTYVQLRYFVIRPHAAWSWRIRCVPVLFAHLFGTAPATPRACQCLDR